MRDKWVSPCGTVTLYLGDCLEILPTLSGIDAVVTDPPYGISYCHSGCGHAATGRTALRRFMEEITGDNKPFDPVPFNKWPCVMFGADHYANRLFSNGTFHWWDKAHSGGPKDDFSDAECFWTSWQCKRRVVRYLWKGVCQDGEKGVRKFHPSQKPIAVMETCVEMAQARTILDPYMGSGTTGVAAVRLGRRFVGVEIEPKYFAISKKRIQDELNRFPLFEEPKAEQLTLLDGSA